MRYLFLYIAIIGSLTLQAQQPSKVLMMNGRTYDVKLKELAPPTIQFEWNKNHKIYNPSPDKVFSITDSTGKKTVIYRQDSLYGNYFSANDMQSFIYGFNDGRRYRWGGDFAIGFGSGMAGSFLGAIYGWSGPILATSINVSLKPKATSRILRDHPTLEYDKYYLAGMRRKVRTRKMLGTMLGGAVGMAVGITIFQFFVRNPLTDN
ncbi:MAG: hypothetical protein M0D57_21245 [Sphingobacteriales bacterium JAD_PAG50586_3]|nr:MAG: hypothetical protein M0D57_21245 [Sphingobacteriales bacterium JAD_PAG50586_3]